MKQSGIWSLPLEHSTTLIKQFGRQIIFVVRLIDWSKAAKQLNNHIRLNISAWSDIQWWYQFAARLNGASMLLKERKLNLDAVFTSGASGNRGCGGYCGAVVAASVERGHHSRVHQLSPIVLVSGESWSGTSVLVRSDNAAVVAVLNSSSGKGHWGHTSNEVPGIYSSKIQLHYLSQSPPSGSQSVSWCIIKRQSSILLYNYPQAQPAASPMPQAL